MYQVQIIYGMRDAHGKEFERELENTNMPVVGNDLDEAKAEADRYSLWEHNTARYHHAATVANELPNWKKVPKKDVYEKKYTVRPIDESEGQYVIVRVLKV